MRSYESQDSIDSNSTNDWLNLIVKPKYAEYYSEKKVKDRQWRIDNEKQLIFQRYFMGAAEEEAAQGNDEAVVNRFIGESQMYKIWNDLDFFIENCAVVGLKVKLGHENDIWRRFVIYGWSPDKSIIN